MFKIVDNAIKVIIDINYLKSDKHYFKDNDF